MDFVSPTHGRLSFERMFRQLVAYMQEQPAERYNLIIGTDSLLGDDTCFVTAIIIHRVGHGGRYFYHKFRNRKIESLRHRILFETSLSLETASLVSAQLVKNGYRELPVEIHLDVGDRGETKRIIREVVGMVQGSGFAAITKPDAYGASKVADRETGKLRVAERARGTGKGDSVGSKGAGGAGPVSPTYSTWTCTWCTR
ncbi:MAG: hypothetical protein AUI83_23075 [Armatimonadetes bacterium 13_1_40CM_3_65_7]|nr:MAG: hypothetical protein AUI83_23075 [Armatimonadetes bacterium 13_1_40CM_3_65_7]